MLKNSSQSGYLVKETRTRISFEFCERDLDDCQYCLANVYVIKLKFELRESRMVQGGVAVVDSPFTSRSAMSYSQALA